MRYINIDDSSDGLAELCAKEALAKTKEAHVYWVNKDLFNTGYLNLNIWHVRNKIVLFKLKSIDTKVYTSPWI